MTKAKSAPRARRSQRATAAIMSMVRDMYREDGLWNDEHRVAQQYSDRARRESRREEE